jgi:general secretion pathway protein D
MKSRHYYRSINRPILKLPILAILLTCVILAGSVIPTHAQGQKKAPSSNTITIQLKNIDVIEVLKTLSEKGDLNIAVSPGVQGRVTLFIEEIDVLEALDIVIETAGLAYVREDGVIKVMTQKQYEGIYGMTFKDRQVTETRQLKHIDVSQVNQTLSQLKSPTGKIIVDPRTNTVVMIDAPEAIRKMRAMIAEVDVPVTTEIFDLKHTTPNVISQTIKPLLTPSGKINTDPRTNKVIVTDTSENVARVSEIIKVYDVAPYTESRIFALSYADPQEIASKLTPEMTPGLGTIQPIANTNNVMVTDLPHKLGTLSDIISALDIRTKEVLIEARIVRVSLTDRYRMGINWEFLEAEMNNLDVKNTFNILPTDDVGVRVTSGNLNQDRYTAMVEALQTVGKTNLLASPRITALHGKESKILVGSNVPYTTIDTREEDGVIRTFEKVTIVDVGIKLYVTPLIHEDGFVTMDIKPEVSSVIGMSESGVPIVETSQTETSVMIKDGITIVLSGLIEEKESKTVNKVPILGSIPLLGYLFSNTDRSIEKSELVILLTPTIITGDVNTEEVSKFEEGVQ